MKSQVSPSARRGAKGPGSPKQGVQKQGVQEHGAQDPKAQTSKAQTSKAQNPKAQNPKLHGSKLRRTRAQKVATLTLVLGCAVVVTLPVSITLSLGANAFVLRDYPDEAVTGTITAVLRAIADTASMVSLGAIISALFLQRLRRTRDLDFTDAFDLRVLRIAALVWLLSGLALVVAEAADSNGLSLARLAESGALWPSISTSPYSRAWLVSTVAAGVIYVITFFSYRWWQLILPLIAASIGALAPVVVGSVLVGPDHDFGTDAATLSMLIATPTLGAWLVTSIRVGAGRPVQTMRLFRLSTISLIALPIGVICEVVVTWFKLAGTPMLTSLTGILGLVRILCLLAVLAIALWLRGRLRGRSADGSSSRDTPANPMTEKQSLSTPPATLNWAAATITAGTLALVFVAAQVAMTRYLSPQHLVKTSITEVFLGFDLLRAPGLEVLLTTWRPNLLFSFIALMLMVVYGYGLYRLHRAAKPWPKGRVVAWYSGCIVLIGATSSGFGKYSGADFAVHMGVHMVLNMLVPLLLVLGGFVTLLLNALPTSRPPGPREWLNGLINSPFSRVIYNPLIVFVLFVGSYYVLYLSGLFELMTSDHWAHQLMNLHFLIIGYIYYGLAIGVDRTPYQLPHIARLGFVFAAMPFHAFFGVIVMSSQKIIAKNYYEYLDVPWTLDLLATQRLGGGIAWAGGEIPLLLVILSLTAQWARSDYREARRKDRASDSGLSDELDAYNQMLQRLAERDRKQQSGTQQPRTQHPRNLGGPR